MKGTKFEVEYASGRTDQFFAKNKKHCEMCRHDLHEARKLGAVIGWKETAPKPKTVRFQNA